MKYVIRKVPERDTKYLEDLMPGAMVYNDVEHVGPIESFVRAMEMAADDAVYVQDDMILCESFMERCEAEIAKHGNDVIVLSNFTCFDGETRVLVPGYYRPMQISWVLCTYIPQRIASLFVREYRSGRVAPNKYQLTQQSDDILFSKFLLDIGEESYLAVPNLAGHPINHSTVNSHRDSKKRMCMNFEYDKAVPRGDMARELEYYRKNKASFDAMREQQADMIKGGINLWMK